MKHIKDYTLFKESLDAEAITEGFSSSILRYTEQNFPFKIKNIDLTKLYSRKDI